MTDWIIRLDHDITLAINSAHTPAWDSVMLFLSSHTVWIPLYVAIAVLMFIPIWYGRKSTAFKVRTTVPAWLIGLIGVLCVLLCFGLTEQITNLVKNWVQRPRPGHDPLLEGLLHLPQGAGGLYGFFSAHAANTFGLAVLTALIFRRGWYSALMCIWAAAVGFSRIYLARHFTSDVICGSLAGILVATAVWLLYRYILDSLSRRYTRRHAMLR